MNRLLISLFVIHCSLFTLAGCGSGKVGVSGTVKFSDGTPLTRGFVIFEQGTYQVFGEIKPDGTYQMGEDQSAGGIKSGEYAVRINSREGGGSDGKPLVRFVAMKFENTATSGLVCKVCGKTKFDIEVEKQ